MSKETDKFVKDFKATKAKLKELSVQNGEKMKKALVTNLDKTWKAEDAFAEAIVKARTGGETSKKASDYLKIPEVGKPYKIWLGMLKEHAKAVDKFDDFHDESKKMEMELGKRVTAVEKELKKSGGMGDIKVAAVVQEAKRALPLLKKAAGLMGTMQAHVVMYGANEQRTIDAIVKQAIDSVTPKEFPEAFDEKNRKKTEKILKDSFRKASHFAELADKAMDDGDEKKANQEFKKAMKFFKPLEGLEKEAKTTATKMKKELKEAKDGKQIEALIKEVRKKHDQLADTLKEIEEKIDMGPQEE